MKLFSRMFVVPAVVLSLGLAACGSDTVGVGELTQAQIAGSYNVTALKYKEINGSKNVDLIASGTYSGGTATVDANGNFSATFNSPLGSVTQTGTIIVTPTAVTLTRLGESPENVTAELNGTTFTIVEHDVQYAFKAGDAPSRTDFTQVWVKTGS